MYLFSILSDLYSYYLSKESGWVITYTKLASAWKQEEIINNKELIELESSELEKLDTERKICIKTSKNT